MFKGQGEEKITKTISWYIRYCVRVNSVRLHLFGILSVINMIIGYGVHCAQLFTSSFEIPSSCRPGVFELVVSIPPD
jgi:hypothetical protein